jgi:hypothetical protein
MKSVQDIVLEIEEFVQQSSYLEKLCELLDLSLVASPLYNFRDALSHYVRFYDATTDEERIAQTACLEEHLFRGIKDGILFIVYEMRGRVSSALNKCKLSGTRANVHDLRSLLHEYKDFELRLRQNSETGINRALQAFIMALGPVIAKTQEFFNRFDRT